jgi:hypothetical protein
MGVLLMFLLAVWLFTGGMPIMRPRVRVVPLQEAGVPGPRVMAAPVVGETKPASLVDVAAPLVMPAPAALAPAPEAASAPAPAAAAAPPTPPRPMQ